METPILNPPVPGSTARWHLSAPESYVLLYGSRAKGVEAFKRGLLELVALGVLTIETRARDRFFVFTSRTSVLLSGPNMGSVERAARPLRSIWDLYIRTPCYDPPGVRIRDLRGAARALGPPLKDYARWGVLPALRERGLYRREDYAARGRLPLTRYVETAAGTAARLELQALMESTDREFGTAAKEDPGRALALARMLGPAVLLMGPLLPEIARLSHRLRHDIGNSAVTTGFDLGTSDIDLEGLDLGALDTLDGAFDAVGDLGDGGGGGWGDGDGGGDGGGDSGGGGGGD